MGAWTDLELLEAILEELKDIKELLVEIRTKGVPNVKE